MWNEWLERDNVNHFIIMSGEESGDKSSGDTECKKLISCFLDAVKQCQRRFGGKKELASDGDSCVACICAQLESVLQHKLRKSVCFNKSGAVGTPDTKISVIDVVSKSFKTFDNSNETVFWHFVREFLSRHEQERYVLLKNITNDCGRGRAWLRSTLNEHSLERYLHILLGDVELLNKYYEDSALMRNQEFSTMLPNMAAGLGSILFAININNSDLNSYRDSTSSFSSSSSAASSNRNSQDEPKPVVIVPSGRDRCRKKRVPAQFAIFDDEEENNFIKVSNSAPSTCLSSPIDLGSCFRSKMYLKSTSESEDMSDYHARFHSEENLSSSRREVPTMEGEEKVEDHAVYSVYNPVALGGFAVMDDEKKLEESSSEDEDKLTDLNLSKSGDEKERCLKSSCEKLSTSLPSHWGGLGHLQVQRSKQHPRSSMLEPLTPINDISVGELFPIGNNEEIHSEDSVSIPSYSEDTDNAALGLALAQRALRNNNDLSSTSRGITDQLSCNQSAAVSSTTMHKTEDLSADELKQALLTVMQKKDELEEQNNSLRGLLEKEMEMSAGLRVENENMKCKCSDMVTKVQSRLQTVSRENELLKHQLRKYIGAVQVLKRNGTEAHEALACLNREGVLGVQNFPDYHFEATEYEKKLIQVAEMHGELMEFNDRLHRLLSQKELDVRRLREELVELRGPFPDDALTSDDDLSITSDYDTSSLTAAARSHINVWIPSVFLTGRSSDVHHVYQVYIRIRDDEWNIYRRYAQFYALHKDIRRKIAAVNTFDFPPKKVIGNKDAKFVEERRKRLQHYLRSVVNLIVQNNQELASNPDKAALMALLPFFSEFANNQQGHRSRPRRGVHHLFSRQPSAVTPPDESPASHYAGL